jgi:hypothetical protein
MIIVKRVKLLYVYGNMSKHVKIWLFFHMIIFVVLHVYLKVVLFQIFESQLCYKLKLFGKKYET